MPVLQCGSVSQGGKGVGVPGSEVRGVSPDGPATHLQCRSVSASWALLVPRKTTTTYKQKRTAWVGAGGALT